jgi:hypothetical protein
VRSVLRRLQSWTRSPLFAGEDAETILLHLVQPVGSIGRWSTRTGLHGRMKPIGRLRRQRAADARHVTSLKPNPLRQAIPSLGGFFVWVPFNSTRYRRGLHKTAYGSGAEVYIGWTSFSMRFYYILDPVKLFGCGGDLFASSCR